ncbi:MAG: hypothetical protein ACREV9_11840 [Burkholderiales bacterium]
MLNRYSVIAIALFSFAAQNTFAGNEQAQRMIQPIVSASGTSLPASLTHKASSQDQGRSLLAPTFVSVGYVGASAAVVLDGHVQARRMLVGQ